MARERVEVEGRARLGVSVGVSVGRDYGPDVSRLRGVYLITRAGARVD